VTVLLHESVIAFASDVFAHEILFRIATDLCDKRILLLRATFSLGKPVFAFSGGVFA